MFHTLLKWLKFTYEMNILNISRRLLQYERNEFFVWKKGRLDVFSSKPLQNEKTLMISFIFWLTALKISLSENLHRRFSIHNIRSSPHVSHVSFLSKLNSSIIFCSPSQKYAPRDHYFWLSLYSSIFLERPALWFYTLPSLLTF